MIHQQDLLEKKIASLQQLVQELTVNSVSQTRVYKKISASANHMPTILEEEDQEDNSTKQRPSSKTKSKGLKTFLKNIRSFFKRIV